MFCASACRADTYMAIRQGTDAMNPWKLTARNVQVMDSLIEHGRSKIVARKLNMSTETIKDHLMVIRLRMRCDTTMQAVSVYVRWQANRDAQDAQRA